MPLLGLHRWMEAPVTYLLPSSIIKGESEGVSDEMMMKQHPISIWYVVQPFFCYV
jgi:hypothetical protein